MKKIVAVIISAVMLITLAAFSVNAATATATMDKVTAKAGDTVTLTVSVKDTEPLVSAAIEINKLPDGFKIKEGKWGGETFMSDFKDQRGVCAYKDAVKSPLDIFTLTLEVGSDIAPGDYNIGFEFQYSNKKGKKLQTEETAGVVTIPGEEEAPEQGEEETPGDEEPDDVTPDDEKVEKEEQPEKKTEKKPFDWKLTLLIVAGVLVLAGLVITITTTTKKSKK